ncbi:MAG: hypothetical protein QOJ16_2104 [Acidobacteriota bacterium]|jgi:hypothetical protein|nr:hypothetical protein [Acidobacteriota bacterium]
MIVYDEGETLLLITQPDHAHFTGELLALWREDGLPDHPRRADLLFAGREHDNGWRETDAAPHCDSGRGRPHDFMSIPRDERIAIWERGTARFAGSQPYASLLITRHSLTLHSDRRGEPEWQDFFAYADELERGLLEATGATLEEVAADYRFLDLGDLASLVVCNRWSDPFFRHGMRGAFAGGTLHLDPLPLAGATSFAIPCRRIPARPYRGDADLGGELAAARWEEMRVRVAPA